MGRCYSAFRRVYVNMEGVGRFEKFFRLVSYAAVFCAFLALWVSGTFGFLATGLFLATIVAAWFLEDSRYQIGERLGTALIVFALPFFYIIWNSEILTPAGGETWIAGLLARMILCLTGIKLLQKKSERDWIFLYLMAFFQVLLAAGLSISGLYLVTFVVYLLLMACAIVAFEMRKTSGVVSKRLSAAHTLDPARVTLDVGKVRIFLTATALVVLIVGLAFPLFFILPRVGGAGFGGDQRGMALSGFSDRVTLGQFGRITEDDRIVMRVRLSGTAAITNRLYFRGIALDTFDNRSWSRSRQNSQMPFTRGSRDTVRFARPASGEMLIDQTVYLEPIDTAVLFALGRPVAIQGNFPVLNVDAYGSISHMRTSERISYRVISDLSRPGVAELRSDNGTYAAEQSNYLALPSIDRRIERLASEITSQYTNRYDKARAVESYLQNSFGYTLEQKASGAEPLADFLFNVKEGHCEYFATAMAVLLRTQGIATRVVNGFSGGDYNDASEMTVIRQRHAHAWVEVYFPAKDAWITFDPTPFAGQPGSGTAEGSMFAGASKYLEALEAFWIQYFVAYDDREQRSLGRTVRSGLSDYQSRLSAFIGVGSESIAAWVGDLKGERGLGAGISAVLYAAGLLLGAIVSVWLLFRLMKFIPLRALLRRLGGAASGDDAKVEFYERLLAVLARSGLRRSPSQTPFEFALATGNAEAVLVTEKYQRVRFGGVALSDDEAAAVDEIIRRLEKGVTA